VSIIPTSPRINATRTNERLARALNSIMRMLDGPRSLGQITFAEIAAVAECLQVRQLGTTTL